MDMMPIFDSQAEEKVQSLASVLIGELDKQRAEEQILLSRSEAVKSAVLEELRAKNSIQNGTRRSGFGHRRRAAYHMVGETGRQRNAQNNQTALFNG